jgi:3-hydroxyisobutyrate dehydrogenase
VPPVARDGGYLQAKGAAILAGDFSPSFTVELTGQDARLISEAAVSAGIRLDVAPAVAGRFRRAAESARQRGVRAPGGAARRRPW